MQLLIFTVIFVLIGSGLMALVEAALLSIPLSQVRVLAEKKRRGAESLLAIKQQIRRPITVLVACNNAITIIGSGLVATMTARLVGETWVAVITGILTLLIIIFAEIIPKSIGETYAARISLLSARPLQLLAKIFTPFVIFIEWTTARFIKKESPVTEEEIRILSQIGHQGGTIEEDEKEMIQRIFRLNDLTARDIMTPRTVISALESGKLLREVEQEIYALPHSRVPLYHETLDSIIGIAYQREMLSALARDEKDRKITDFLREALFVPETTKVDKLLTLFQKTKNHLAIVVDEFGGTAGVVTLEDALEQLVGEIVDEKDVEVDKRLGAKNSRKDILDQAANI